MDRNDIEQSVRRVYEARLSNDAGAIGALFREEAAFELAGRQGDAGSIAVRVEGGAQVRHVLAELGKIWRWHGYDILDLLIDGDNAAVRYRVAMTFVPGNENIETEIFDLLTIRDGRLSRMIEFCDTGHAGELMARAAAVA